MARLAPSDANDILQRCGIVIGQDFHTLNTSTVEALLIEADKRGYRKPSNANGSRGRYFHEYVQRVAARILSL